MSGNFHKWFLFQEGAVLRLTFGLSVQVDPVWQGHIDLDNYIITKPHGVPE